MRDQWLVMEAETFAQKWSLAHVAKDINRACIREIIH